MMIIEILGALYKWLPTAFFWMVFVLAAGAYLWRNKISLGRWSKRLIWATSFYYLAYAAISTVLQYFTWENSGTFTQKFLGMPINSVVQNTTFWGRLPFIANSKLGYFMIYSWGRFWLGALLTIGCGFLFLLILKSLKKYRDRFFEDGEVELGALLAMLGSWPQFVVFLPFVFVFVVIVSIARLIFFKEAYTTLGIPMLFAALLTYILSINNILKPLLEKLAL